MKKIFLSICTMLFAVIQLQGQTTVMSTGMSIQGIARDENNAALNNFDQLALNFVLYYTEPAGEVAILSKTANVKTDNFGVFSYVLEITELQFNLLNTKPAYLKVSQGSVVFSNEKLQSVPYAINAMNGVPTGSIMPYIGTVAPPGWLLCDGSAIADNAYTANLISLLGQAVTPDLNGLFLRGTGSHAAGKVGPDLMTVQSDDLAAHHHYVDINTNTTGAHTHKTGFGNDDYNGSGGNNKNGLEDDISGGNNRELSTTSSGNHNHTVKGNTNDYGTATETRPINYGVNYIIKI